MRLFFLPAVLTAGLLSAQAFAATPDAAEAAAVRSPLESYLKGHASGDGAYMRKAFLPTAHIEGIRDG